MGKGTQCLYLFHLRGDPPSSHNMAQVPEFVHPEQALFGVGVQPCGSEGSQHLPEVVQMLIPIPAEDKNVIQIGAAEGPTRSQHAVDQALEGGRSPVEVDDRDVEQPLWCGKGCLFAVLGSQQFLPVPFVTSRDER